MVVFYGCTVYGDWYNDLHEIVVGDEFIPLPVDLSWWIVPGTLDLED